MPLVLRAILSAVLCAHSEETRERASPTSHVCPLHYFKDLTMDSMLDEWPVMMATTFPMQCSVLYSFKPNSTTAVNVQNLVGMN